MKLLESQAEATGRPTYRDVSTARGIYNSMQNHLAQDKVTIKTAKFTGK